MKEDMGFWKWFWRGITNFATLSTCEAIIGLAGAVGGASAGIVCGVGYHPLFFLFLLAIPAGVILIAHANYREEAE